MSNNRPPSEFVEAARRTVRASIDKPSAARVYDYFLGSNHNFPVDREFAETQATIYPDLRMAMRTSRAFLQRTVRCAVNDHGIRQFIDFGSGLPSAGNVHDTADSHAPNESKVIYVDNEPVAHAHAMVLLSETSDMSRHLPISADFLDSATTWERIMRSGYIDLSKPVAMLAVALLHFMPPDLEPERHLAFYRDQLPPGSLLAISHACNDQNDPAFEAVRANYDAHTTHRAHFRDRPEVTALFGDYELLEPGVVWATEWRPAPKYDEVVMKDVPIPDDPARTRVLVGVGRKP